MNNFVRHVTIAALCAPAAVGVASRRAPEAIAANDNRRPAGTLVNGVLTVRLEARDGMWRPEGERSRAVRVAAWAEEGKPLSAPGPLIRVRAGTVVRASLRNSLDQPLTVYGFGKTRGMSDSVAIQPGASRDVQFTAETPGTYYYLGRRGVNTSFFGVPFEYDTELSGAIVVDPPVGAPANDRVFVLTAWFTIDEKSPSGLGRSMMAINGLSWPYTERVDLTQGDSAHWRVINLSSLDHPMHLHGFYFRLETRGDGVRDTVYATEQQHLSVTEISPPFSTMSLSWVPDRSGNWIYHCHYADHIARSPARDTDRGDDTTAHPHATGEHAMYGLVLGLRVAPNGPAAKLAEGARRIRMIVRQTPAKSRAYGTHEDYAMVLGGTPAETAHDAMPVPGPALVLERGKPVAITVVNRAKHPTSIHWHGIELESYPDGVPGWSGTRARTLPSIAPGDSITVRYTPPRTGTFMYHSHFDEAVQISAGLYGPIIVVEPGQSYDQERDRVLMLGPAGPTTNVIFGPFAPYIMNGVEQPQEMKLRAGTTYRFRLINVVDDAPALVTLEKEQKPVMWRAVAKDGADLPPSQATLRPAVLFFDPGEIYDFEFTPDAPGDLALTFGPPPLPPGVTWPANFAPLPSRRTVMVHVR